MADALAIAARSMADDMLRLGSISHNLANATTAGYKREMMVSRPFADYLMTAAGPGFATLAVSLPEPQVLLDHAAGSLQYTGNPLDIAVEGDGFFELSSENGPIYTRQGNFRLDGVGRLVSSGGLVVTGTGGEIRVVAAQPRIDGEGRVWDGDLLAGQLRLVRFEQPQALIAVGAGGYVAGAQQPELWPQARTRQGYLEASNVVTTREMVRLIETMRHFESNQKVIQGYDEMLERTIRTLGEF